MKKLLFIVLFILFVTNLYSKEVILGIEWNMSKSEVKKILGEKKLRTEIENELIYGNVQMADDEINLDQTMDVVSLVFENNKLSSVKGLITKPGNVNNIPIFSNIMSKCSTNQGSVEIPNKNEKKIVVLNKEHYYGCTLDYSQELMDLFIIYYNPKKFQ